MMHFVPGMEIGSTVGQLICVPVVKTKFMYNIKAYLFNRRISLQGNYSLDIFKLVFISFFFNWFNLVS